MNNSIIFQAKNQKNRLLPWILYHHFQGFNKFIYFDDFSEDDSIEYIKQISSKFGIDIIVQYTDGIGSQYAFSQTQNSNSYGGDGNLNNRIVRSYNTGIDILKQFKNDYVAFIDVDEFIVTSSSHKISEILSQYKLDQIYVQSYDIKDDYDLENNFYICDVNSRNRWCFQDRQKTIFSARGKSIIKYDKLKYLRQVGNEVHTLGNNNYSVLDPNFIRIHHFRKPCLDYSVKWIEDNTLAILGEDIKKFYGI